MLNQRCLKRLQREKEENNTPGENFYIQPIQNKMHEWHFTLIGVKGTPYEGGIYHGKIVLPMTYPIHPPDIYFFNESGRYRPNTKICLNITSYHREQWTPTWRISTMMNAVSAYFVCDEGGVGSMRLSAAERKKIAVTSRDYKCVSCGDLVQIEKKIK